MKAEEILGQVLLSWHNIAFYQSLMAAMRDAIREGRFEAWRKAFHAAISWAPAPESRAR
jgi:queuine tRNA-ribosyltransferase